jgi:hypothetical protein
LTACNSNPLHVAASRASPSPPSTFAALLLLLPLLLLLIPVVVVLLAAFGAASAASVMVVAKVPTEPSCRNAQCTVELLDVAGSTAAVCNAKATLKVIIFGELATNQCC